MYIMINNYFFKNLIHLCTFAPNQLRKNKAQNRKSIFPILSHYFVESTQKYIIFTSFHPFLTGPLEQLASLRACRQ